MNTAPFFVLIFVLWLVAVFSGWPKPWVANVLLAVLLALIGWEVFGPLLKK